MDVRRMRSVKSGKYSSALRVVLEGLERRALLSVTYSVIDLGTVDGGNHTFNPVINVSGEVAGTGTDTQSHARAFLYSGSGPLVDLGTPVGPLYFSASSVGINASGTVAGNSFLTNNLTHALESGSGGFTDLGTLSGAWDESFAAGLNDSGTVVGRLFNSSTSATHAFQAVGGSISDLGIVSTAGFDQSEAWAINNSGEVVGTATDSVTNVTHAFVEVGGTMTDIGLPSGGFTNSFAQAVNSNGDVAVYAFGNGTHGFIYSNGTFHDIGNLGGNGQVSGINDSGVVIGTEAIGLTDVAFVYQNGVLQNLNTLIPANSGWTLDSATGINASGQIVGNGHINGLPHAFLLTPSGSPSAATFTPTLTTNGLPATVVVGAKVKGKFTVTVSTTSVTPISGKVTVNVYGLLGVGATPAVVTPAVTAKRQLATVTKTLKVSLAKPATVHLSMKALPANVTAGSYTLEAETVVGNVTTTSAAGGSLTVQAPVVALSASVGAVSPATISVGKTGGFTVTVTDTGNTDATGSATITVGYATSSLATPTLGVPQTKTLKVTVGKPVHLKLKTPALPTVGTFVPYVTITEDGVTTSAFGATGFVVSA